MYALAGILLKMRGYGLIRINMELLPHAHSIFAPWIVAVGAIQIVYASLISLDSVIQNKDFFNITCGLCTYCY
uniref:Uncharacterized protein n=1 Tax=Physcomitrium patens TaxID=3218 RepID=A0A2K1L0Z3_PHYPA|nr:hypothetical protein PHYPA_002492 [Physcomitrium patens]